MMIRAAGRGIWRDERGAAIAELALVLPFLFLMIFGMFEFGRALYQQNIVTKGVQDAARFVARHPKLIEGGSCAAANISSIETTAKELAVRGGSTTAPLILPNFTASTIVVSVSCYGTTTLDTPTPLSSSIPVVTVTASGVAFTPIFPGYFGLSSINLSAAHTEMGVGL